MLVIDDEHDVQEAIGEVLADHDYEPCVASNGREALERLREMDEKPCVILLDLKMPIMNGFEFRAAQQADPILQRIPVIVITANFQPAEVADLRLAGFVQKPFDADALVDTVKAACRAAVASTDSAWFMVADGRPRWERTGFGAIEPRGSTLWAALPTCGHDYYVAVNLAEAQQQLEEQQGMCLSCWQRTLVVRRSLRRGQTTPPDGTSFD